LPGIAVVVEDQDNYVETVLHRRGQFLPREQEPAIAAYGHYLLFR
jgi:hypothetical protein